MYQFLIDCQQPAAFASVSPLSPQLRRARASVARSPCPSLNIVIALQEDQTPPLSSSSRDPLDALNSLVQQPHPPGP
ncbi:hypothetical protein J4Q44_G00113120 [Coregonus suidteri]|uniref:Uncharacterized protein n=1 Tax=Coregonus suidteri TaxID=861788 RepID=A0AAN8QZF4_9TELE